MLFQFIVHVIASTASIDPVANHEATVTFSNVRFTILTDALVRMEKPLTRNSTFEDRPTLTFINRKLPVPRFSVKEAAGALTIETDAFALTYTPGEHPRPRPSSPSCRGYEGFDAVCGDGSCLAHRSPSAPDGLPNLNKSACCSACEVARDCAVWIHENTDADKTQCFLLTSASGRKQSPLRTTGGGCSGRRVL